MNAISGPAQNGAITRLLTDAPVRPVLRVAANLQRARLVQVDRYEPSARRAAASPAYGRNGLGGRVDADGD